MSGHSWQTSPKTGFTVFPRLIIIIYFTTDVILVNYIDIGIFIIYFKILSVGSIFIIIIYLL